MAGVEIFQDQKCGKTIFHVKKNGGGDSFLGDSILKNILLLIRFPKMYNTWVLSFKTTEGARAF